MATHGLILERQPGSSSLLFAPEPDGSEDGLLQVREVFALERVPELVVLSACRTAVGELAGGEGVIGFARAFLAAGAGDVVVALWSVHDAASLALMPVFYSALVGGAAPDEALRRAKLWYLREGHTRMGEITGKDDSPVRGDLTVVRGSPVDTRHPFYWAPCVVVGRGGGFKATTNERRQ